MAAAAAGDDTSKLMQLLQVHLRFLVKKKPKTLLYLSLTPHPQAIELCDEDAQLNVAAFELAQRLHM